MCKQGDFAGNLCPTSSFPSLLEASIGAFEHKNSEVAAISTHKAVALAVLRWVLCQLQSDDGFLSQQSVSDSESSARALAQDADLLQEVEELYLQPQSEVSQETPAISEDDSIAAQIMGTAMSDHFSLMEGSLDTADWTTLDKEAVSSRSDVDANLSWSIVVSFLR